jgi:putative addiction module component (TIGR02574 family)
MQKKFSIADILELSPAERILLVEEIWDSIASVPESVEVTPTQREELDRRLEAFRHHLSAGKTWEAVKGRVLGAK